jgi:hypothetical protein
MKRAALGLLQFIFGGMASINPWPHTRRSDSGQVIGSNVALLASRSSLFLGKLLAIVLSSATGLWKLFRDQAERGSWIGLKLFGFIPESVFTIIPESCSGSPRNKRSESSRNRVHFRPDSSTRGTWVRLDRPGR